MPRPNDRPQTLLSVPQVADILNVSTRTVRRMLGHALHFHRVASAIRVSQDDLHAYIRSTRE
jgi:excisionase family DNA binding protein